MSAPGAPRRLVISPRVNVEAMEDDAVVVFHTDTSSRLRLARPLYEALNRFQSPLTVDEALPDARPELLASLVALEQRGYLMEAGQPVAAPAPRLLATSTHTLFQCPRRRPGDRPTDVAVIGVPCDLGVRGWPGSRHSPEEVRKRSYDFIYRCAMGTGEPMGWFDVARRERILEGVTFADWGDLWFRYGESLATVHARLEEVCRDVVEGGSFPLLLGGDQSLAFAPVAALQAQEPLSVLWLDAHTDYDHTPPGAALNHYSVARGIHALPGVVKLVQVGHRGYTANDKITSSPDLEIITGPDLQVRGVRAVVEALPPEHPVYVSVDVNILDPVFAPAATSPAPGGLTLEALKELLVAVGAERRVVGMDLCELNPERDVGSITAITACHVLLAGLGAFMRGSRRGEAAAGDVEETR
jgi:arginase family enzyme